MGPCPECGKGCGSEKINRVLIKELSMKGTRCGDALRAEINIRCKKAFIKSP